jgi:hypothetical protein
MGDTVSSLGDSVSAGVRALGREALCSSARRPVEADAAGAARDRAALEKLKAKLHHLNEHLDVFVEQEIICLFADADVDSSNALSTEEVSQLLQLLGEQNFGFTVAMRCFDFNRNGSIEQEEFEAAIRAALFDRPDNLEILVQSCEDIENHLNEAWTDAYASIGTLISVPDVARLMRELLAELGHSDKTVELQSDSGCSPKASLSHGAGQGDFAAQVGLFDGDGDGHLTRDEFFQAYGKFLVRIYGLPACTPLVPKTHKSGIFKRADKGTYAKAAAEF